jgi:hypothetical protein
MRPGSNTRRPRGRPNRKQHGSPRSQTFDSHGPDVRIRGNAPQVYEKYLTLARDATSSGDRIAAESYYQFAEHYFRIMNDSTDPQRLNPDAPRPNREPSYGEPREQPQVDWPADHRAGNGAPAERPAPAERKETPRRAVSEDSEPPLPEEQAAPEAADEDAPPPEEKAAPRRAAKGRPRGRRRTANGADDSAAEPAAKASAEPEEKKPSKKKSDDSEEAVPQ